VITPQLHNSTIPNERPTPNAQNFESRRDWLFDLGVLGVLGVAALGVEELRSLRN